MSLESKLPAVRELTTERLEPLLRATASLVNKEDTALMCLERKLTALKERFVVKDYLRLLELRIAPPVTTVLQEASKELSVLMELTKI